MKTDICNIHKIIDKTEAKDNKIITILEKIFLNYNNNKVKNNKYNI